MSIISATWEPEVGRSMPGPWKKCRTVSKNKLKKEKKE
jgi:hypothetical protein